LSPVTTRTDILDDQPACWQEAPTAAGATPVLYVHGVPTNGRLWTPFLERTGGLAPDLPGFGASTKRGDLPYDLPFYAAWLARFCDDRGLDRVRLVAQDWGGGFAAAFAQAAPERVERLVLMDAVPLIAGYRWHRIARAWRTRGLGEVAVGASWRWALKLAAREASPKPGYDRGLVDLIDAHNDVGTQRAILKLYRSADPDVLAAAGARLGEVTCPALVLWGAQDPYIPVRFCDAYAALLGGEVEREVLDGAGHWPWLDRPEVVDRVVAFLDAA
jgi:pimeloyl-ACP methyl ester carboxylesterase